MRTALRHLLQDAGPWEIVDVSNGAEAIAKAQEIKPNLIILDLVMPVMDGLSAARELSKLLPEIPMLMHTMHWSPQVEVEAQKVGVQQVVSKANSKLLIATVKEFLASPPPAAASALQENELPAPNVIQSAAISESKGPTAVESDSTSADPASQHGSE